MALKKSIVFILFVMFFYIFMGFLSSASIPAYTDNYVNDFSSVLDSSQAGDLRALFYSIDLNTTAEVVFVSDNECASKGGQRQYSLDILNSWKVGKADKNNGMVILYCKQENKIFVSVGYGLEGILPDSKIGRYLDDYYVPLRDSGNVTQGIISFSNQIAIILSENAEEIRSGKASPDYQGSGRDAWTIILIVFFIYMIISKIIGAIFRNKYKGKKRNTWPWFVPIFIPIGSGRSSGGFGGGGFGGGFGGGGGGGGGAGR